MHGVVLLFVEGDVAASCAGVTGTHVRTLARQQAAQTIEAQGALWIRKQTDSQTQPEGYVLLSTCQDLSLI